MATTLIINGAVTDAIGMYYELFGGKEAWEGVLDAEVQTGDLTLENGSCTDQNTLSKYHVEINGKLYPVLRVDYDELGYVLRLAEADSETGSPPIVLGTCANQWDYPRDSFENMTGAAVTNFDVTLFSDTTNPSLHQDPTVWESAVNLDSLGVMDADGNNTVSLLKGEIEDTTSKFLDKVGLAHFWGNLSTLLDEKADLDSPALTGTPTAPTPESGDSSTKIATTAFVNTLFNSIVDGNEVEY